MAAVIDRLETALVGLIGALGLTLGSTPVVVARQKTAALREGLEAAPLITISAAPQPGKDEWWATAGPASPKGTKQRQYAALVDFAAAGNRDLAANEGTYQQWRQSVMGAVEPIDAWGVPELYDVVVEPGPWIESGSHLKNTDTSKVILRLVTLEPASN